MKKISFLPEPPGGFYATLKQRVQAHFRENKISRYATLQAIMKALGFFGLFITTYIVILTVQMSFVVFLTCWFLLGIFIIFSAMAVVHDAAHGAFSRRKWVNTMLLHFANLAGGDGYMYKYKHTVSHHPYTNIHGIDIDLEQSGIVRVTPYTETTKKHRYQDIYMKILYPFFILFWVLLRDFKYYRMKKIGLADAHHASIHWIVLVSGKLFYFFYMIVLPCIVLPYPIWKVLLGFFVMQIGSGLVAMFALLSNHVVEDSIFISPGNDGVIPYTWGEHQLSTTDDYSPDSPLISFLFSGLNHHVAHHLFPRYCHVHYPAITKLVRTTATEFGLRYRYNSITGGLLSHFKLLKKLNGTH